MKPLRCLPWMTIVFATQGMILSRRIRSCRAFATTPAANQKPQPSHDVVDKGDPRADTSDYRSLLVKNSPLLDVRAPCEFQKGAISYSSWLSDKSSINSTSSISGSINVPVLTDEERHQIGTCYKQKGQGAAIELGYELVSGSVLEERGQQWIQFCKDFPSNGYLCCLRGGLRSQMVQRYIEQETGIRYPLVKGGYKGVRRFLLDELEPSLASTELFLIAGATGSGKTKVIEQLQQQLVSSVSSSGGTTGGVIDLEGLAHHLGSSFGRWPEDPLQPAQASFENSVSLCFLQIVAAAAATTAAKCAGGAMIPTVPIFAEDEGARIGNLCLPTELKTKMKASQVIVVEESLEERIEVILEDYVCDLERRFIRLHGEDHGREQHRLHIQGAMGRLQNRLGGERYQKMNLLMHQAFQEQDSTGDLTLHRVLISELLQVYYDPMYEYQLSQRHDQIVFRGDRLAVEEWTRSKLQQEDR